MFALYPVVMATSTKEIEEHATVFVADAELAFSLAELESETSSTNHESYLVGKLPTNVEEIAIGVFVKQDVGSDALAYRMLRHLKTLGRLPTWSDK